MIKPYKDLTYLGRIKRLRLLAQAALSIFGINESQFVLLRQAGNTLFKVHAKGLFSNHPDEDLFEKDAYLLRIHEPGYQDPDAIRHELAWLSEMRSGADLPVPEPISSPNGDLLIQVSTEGVDQARWCSLFRWVKGRSVLHRSQSYHYREQGKLLARLHQFSAKWPHPVNLAKPRYDWAGLFVNEVGSGMPNAEAWALLNPETKLAFEFVAQNVQLAMDAWGEQKDVFGLIHGDLAVDANLLFWHKKPRAIDFYDSGYGYWLYDIAVGFEHCWDDPFFPAYRDALLEGYTALQPLPDSQINKLDLFIAAVKVYWTLWATGGTHLYPELLPEYEGRIQRNADQVIKFWRRSQS